MEAIQELFDSEPAAVIATTETITNKRKPAQGTNPNSKKPKMNQQQNAGTKPQNKGQSKPKPFPSKGKGGNVDYQKSSIPGARLMYQRSRFYQILCRNTGATQLCSIVYRSILNRDRRLVDVTSELQLRYVTVIAFWARQAVLSINEGYLLAQVDAASDLIRSVKGLQLPSILAKYIESQGIITTSAGISVAPWFSGRDIMQQQAGMINPDDILHAAGRVIPANPWSIDRDWIAAWNSATTRPSRLGMGFRSVKWSELTGSVEMLVTRSPLIIEADTVIPTAPQRLTDVEGTLGAIYNFRDFMNIGFWPEQTALVCTRLFYGTEFHPDQEFSALVVSSFTSRHD